MIQAVFFDFNGVVVDDEPLQMKAYQEVLGREGLSVTEEEYYGSMGVHDVAFLRAGSARARRARAGRRDATARHGGQDRGAPQTPRRRAAALPRRRHARQGALAAAPRRA